MAENVSMNGSTISGISFFDGGMLRAALVFALATLSFFGFSYALLSTGIDRALFPEAADGSLIEREGRIVGSSLVAQPFVDARYFQPRPPAANYDAMAAAGSNQARSNPQLRQRIAEARAAVAGREGIPLERVPADLVTQSGSGVDPHISPESARLQVARVARARGLDPAVVAALLERYVEPPQFGFLGQPRVNVLQLNLALDDGERKGRTATGRVSNSKLK